MEEFGGFLPFSVPPHGGTEMPLEGWLACSGRCAFRWLLQQYTPRRVAMPKWSCDTLLQSFEGLDISTRYYDVDQSFFPLNFNLNPDEMILWINPFGLYDHAMTIMAERYGSSVIFDLTQAFFADRPPECLAFTSFRKFFPLSDGGQALGLSYKEPQCEQDCSSWRLTASLKAAEEGVKAASVLHLAAEESLSFHWRRLSKLTEQCMAAQDFEMERQVRQNNFNVLHQLLGSLNELEWPQSGVPMVYPLMVSSLTIRRRLTEHGVYLPRFWPEVTSRCTSSSFEHQLSRFLLPLPIDRRYDRQAMERLAELVIRAVKAR